MMQLPILGDSDPEIDYAITIRCARTLDLAPSTVKTHLSQVLHCLGATNRTDASLKARMLDLVS
jgi:DNA-binding CsgD family transcriptional regulator